MIACGRQAYKDDAGVRVGLEPCSEHVACLQGIWSRALGLPIERPKSITMEALERKLA